MAIVSSFLQNKNNQGRNVLDVFAWVYLFVTAYAEGGLRATNT